MIHGGLAGSSASRRILAIAEVITLKNTRSLTEREFHPSWA